MKIITLDVHFYRYARFPFIFVHDSFYDVNDLKNNLIRIFSSLQ